MSEIRRTIEEDDVEWLMDWSNRPSGDKTEDEMVFEPAGALALLLLNNVVFLNDHWWLENESEDVRKMVSLNVNCNDVFAWGCADAEELPYREIENLYRMWMKDRCWGPAVWCMTIRKMMPQKPVENMIRKAGIWDLDALALESNTIDEEVAAAVAMAAQKMKEEAAGSEDAK